MVHFQFNSYKQIIMTLLLLKNEEEKTEIFSLRNGESYELLLLIKFELIELGRYIEH